MTCRCRTPKDHHEGICPECEGKAMKQAAQHNPINEEKLARYLSASDFTEGRLLQHYLSNDMGNVKRVSDFTWDIGDDLKLTAKVVVERRIESRVNVPEDINFSTNDIIVFSEGPHGSWSAKSKSEKFDADTKNMDKLRKYHGDLDEALLQSGVGRHVNDPQEARMISDVQMRILDKKMASGSGRSGQGHVTSDGNTVKVTYSKYKAEFNMKTKAAYLDIDGSQIVAIKPLGGFEMKPGRKTGVTFKFDDGGLNEGLVEVINISPEQLQQKFEGNSQVSFFVSEARNKAAFDRIAANLMSVFDDIRKDLEEARSKTTDPKALKDLDAVAKGLSMIERGVTTQGQKTWEPKRVAVESGLIKKIEDTLKRETNGWNLEFKYKILPRSKNRFDGFQAQIDVTYGEDTKIDRGFPERGSYTEPKGATYFSRVVELKNGKLTIYGQHITPNPILYVQDLIVELLQQEEGKMKGPRITVADHIRYLAREATTQTLAPSKPKDELLKKLENKLEDISLQETKLWHKYFPQGKESLESSGPQYKKEQGLLEDQRRELLKRMENLMFGESSTLTRRDLDLL